MKEYQVSKLTEAWANNSLVKFTLNLISLLAQKSEPKIILTPGEKEHPRLTRYNR